jgi:hypothetical protein
MYSCQVGTNFRVGFFKRFLNFCHDKKNNLVYCEDLKTIDKLGIEKSKILETCSNENKNEKIETEIKDVLLTGYTKKICREMIVKVENDLKREIEQLKGQKVLLERTMNELVEFYKELLEVNDQRQEEQEQLFSTLKNSVGILNRKIKEESVSVDNLNLRFEAVVEMLSEHAARSGQLPNVLRSGVTLEKIWNSIQDKNSAAVLSIMFMIKRALEDKGLRLS